MRNSFIFLIFFFKITHFVVAQNDSIFTITQKRLGIPNLSDKKDQTKTQVVSASRSMKKIEDLPLTIHVVSGEEIRRNGYATLTDVLKSVPGIRTSKLFSGMLGEGFLMRGLIGNQYCKILVNNISVQPVVMGNLTINEQLPIAQAEQIEIVFGPAAAVYGADAMAGVINIITKKVSNKDMVYANYATNQQAGQYLNLLIGGKLGRDKNVMSYTLFSNYATRPDQNFSRSSKIFNIPRQLINYYSLQVSEEQILKDSVFYDYFVQYIFPHYKGTIKEAEFGKMPSASNSVGIKWDYRGFTFSVQQMYNKNHSSIGLRPLLYSYHTPNTYLASTTQKMTASYARQFKHFGIQTNLSYLRYRMDTFSSYASTGTNESAGKVFVYGASDDLFAEMITNYQLNHRLEFTVGASMSHASSLPITNESLKPFDQSDYRPFDTEYRPKEPHYLLGYFGYNPVTRTSVGGFAQCFFTWKRFTSILGTRYDKTIGFKPASYQRLSLLYKTSNRSSLRLSLGSAIRVPTPNELYKSVASDVSELQDSTVLYEYVPNTKLEPERLNAVELGFRKRFSKKWDMEIILLTQTIHHLISTIDTDITELGYSNSNLVQESVFTNYNDPNNSLGLAELQVLLKGKNIIPAIKMDLELWAKFAAGQETLPKTEIVIDVVKMLPNRMLQCNLSAQLTKKWYLRMESQWLSSWLSQYLYQGKASKEERIEDEYLKRDPYFNLDLMTNYKLNKSVTIYTRVINVFNQSYGGLNPMLAHTMNYNPQPLRNIYFGMRFHLNR